MQPCALTTHSHTPKLTVVEPRGLTVRSVDYYRASPGDTAEARVNRTAHDPAGWEIAQWDPRLFLDASAPANLSSIHSLSGAILASTSVDAGLRVSLYGEAGQPVYSCDGRGSQRQMHYDDQSRLNAIFEQAVEGEAVCAERLSYAASDQAFADRNQCGRLIRHDDPAGALLFNDYGLTGAVLEQVRCMANERTAGYATLSRVNPLGELLSRTDARGNEQRFSQTLDGLLHAVDLHLNNSVEHLPMVNAITYNAHGQVEKEVAGNGVVTTLEYAAEDGRLKRLLSRLAQSDPLQDLRYLYDPVGNVSSIEDAALPIRYFANQRIEPVSHYRYDTLYRLIEATGWEAGVVKHGPSSAASADPAMPGNYRQTYRYDDGNNLLELTHVGPQNPGHRLVAAAHSNRCLPVRDGIEPDEEDFRNDFDANGNLLKLQPGQTLSWDVRNQLREVRPVERDSGLDDYELYFYGADGMRVRKVRSLQTNAQTVVAQTLYLPGLEIRTHSGTGEELHVIEVATGRGSVRVLHWEKQRPTDITNNQQRYSLTDHLGSSTLELDQDARIITQERYYPFGGTAWSNGEAVQVSYKTVRYSGKEQDATGLYYYGFRYYAPWLQRWSNPDPAGDIDGLNHYRMVRNNPITFFDWRGMMPNSSGAQPPSTAELLTKEEVISEIRSDLEVYLSEIAITDKPFVNSAGMVQYRHDENHLKVIRRRVETARTLGMSLSEASANKEFQLSLGAKVAEDRDENNKIYGQCAEMAYFAASRLKDVAGKANYNVYTLQMPDVNHTILLVSKRNYSSGSNVLWKKEYKSESIIVDLWQGRLSSDVPAALVALAKEHMYTSRGERAIVQVKVWGSGSIKGRETTGEATGYGPRTDLKKQSRFLRFFRK